MCRGPVLRAVGGAPPSAPFSGTSPAKGEVWGAGGPFLRAAGMTTHSPAYLWEEGVGT